MVGVSLGATLAVQVALDHPAAVASLFLSGGQAHPGAAGRLEWSVARVLPERLMVSSVPGDIRTSQPQLAAASVEMQRRVGKRRLVEALRAMSKVDLRPRLGDISVPTLVVCGSKNRASLAGSRALAQGIRGSRLDIIQGAGHVWNLELPQQFNTTVYDFIRTTPHGEREAPTDPASGPRDPTHGE